MSVKKALISEAPESVADMALTLRDTGLQVDRARARIEALQGLKKRIGVIRLWPDQAVAEHENVERIRSAAKLIGVEVVELDRNGYVLGAPEAMVNRDDVDFVIHLHFETPKAYDVPSIAAMWNPMNFYFDWGFDVYWANQMSHDMFAWTGADEIKKMIAQERGDRVAEVMPTFNHTLAGPIFEPRFLADFEIFYCGINWEKISGKPGRHDSVLRSLDSAGKLAIYGPELVQGVNVWEGYSCYKGALPFDGKTVIKKIAEAGVCLVFSSDAHKQSGIMSNRLFEGLAAGAVIIGDEHPFIPQAIGDNFIKVPSQLDSRERVEIILNALKDLTKNPDVAYRMASRAQDVFVEKYFLCSQLVSLFEAYKTFSDKQDAVISRQAQPIVDVVVQPCGLSGQEIVNKLQEMNRGFGNLANIIVVCEKKSEEWMRRHCGRFATVVPSGEDKYEVLAPADAARHVKLYLKTQKIWFSSLVENVFYKQFICAAVAFKERFVGRLGYLLSHTDEAGGIHYDYRSGDVPLERFHEAGRSSIIFDSQWLIENIGPAKIGWRDCVRIAELQERGIAIDQPSTVTINLKAFEKNLQLGYREKPVPGGVDYVSRIGVSRDFSSDSSSVKSYFSIPSDYTLPMGGIDVSDKAKNIFSKILGAGWYNVEQSQVWSFGKRSDLWIQLPPAATRLRVYMSGNPHTPSHSQSVQVFVNMTLVDTLYSNNGEAIAVEISSSSLPWRSNELNKVTFEVSEASSLPEGANDKRTLGVCIKRIEVE